MKKIRLLVVGGGGRNVGKTEFVCRLIRKFSTRTEIYGLKVSAVYPDEALYHGRHLTDSDILFEEVRADTAKDTSRMLAAGAWRVFYLRGDGAGIVTGFTRFCACIPAGAAVICESNSLGEIVRPDLWIMIRAVDGSIKERARGQLARADLVVVSDGQSGFPELERVTLAETGWMLTPED